MEDCGSRAPETHKPINFRRVTDLDSLENYKATHPTFNVEPHQLASQSPYIAFCKCADGGPLLKCRLGFLRKSDTDFTLEAIWRIFPPLLNKLTTKNKTPTPDKTSGYTHGCVS